MNNKKKLAIIAIIASIVLAPLGLVLGITGICRYPKKCDGWWLSITATSMAALNWGTGILLWLAA